MLELVLSIDNLEEKLIVEIKSYFTYFTYTLTEFKLYTHDKFKAELFFKGEKRNIEASKSNYLNSRF